MALRLLVVLVGRLNLLLLVIWAVMSGSFAVVLCWLGWSRVPKCQIVVFLGCWVF